MEKKSFFHTKEGGLTIAFVGIMIAFAVIMTGAGMHNQVLYGIGFLMIMAAMLYSPVKVYIYDRFRKNRS